MNRGFIKPETILKVGTRNLPCFGRVRSFWKLNKRFSLFRLFTAFPFYIVFRCNGIVNIISE